MKHIKGFNENNESNDDSIDVTTERLISNIESIISSEVFLRDVPFGDGDVEKDPDSVKDAAREIVNFLKKNDWII